MKNCRKSNRIKSAIISSPILAQSAELIDNDKAHLNIASDFTSGDVPESNVNDIKVTL